MLPTREFAGGHRHRQCISLGIGAAWPQPHSHRPRLARQLTQLLDGNNARAHPASRDIAQAPHDALILFGERSLRRALSEYVAHYHAARNHQGKSNVLLFRRVTETRREEPVQCRERLGGLLRYYHQEAA